MRRSDLVQHKEKEKGATTRTSQIVFGERSTCCAFWIRWRGPSFQSRACSRSGECWKSLSMRELAS